MKEDKLLFKELSYLVRGLLFAVQNELGRFRNEKQYVDALGDKLKINKITCKSEKVLPQSFDFSSANLKSLTSFEIYDKIKTKNEGF